MNTIPPLPQVVSRDGSELWDWAGKVGGFIQREARIQELRAEIRKCGTVCGDCEKWMKSSECPMERPGEGRRAGYSVGPSMSGMICGVFVETASTTKRRAELQSELRLLES